MLCVSHTIAPTFRMALQQIVAASSTSCSAAGVIHVHFVAEQHARELASVLGCGDRRVERRARPLSSALR
jgi:hypothetical protein